MNIFPFVMQEQQLPADEEKKLPIFKEYAYDFEKNELLLNEKGQTYLLTGNSALKVWIYKALHTERYRYIAYTSDYGNESHTLLGYANDFEITKAELQRYIVETLIFNEYIIEIRNFDFEKNKDGLTVRFEVVTVYGAMDVSWETGGGSYV